ncbi:MAG: N-acetylmuramoyl-L-alanine amidase AmiC precursor [Syntrophaceae bacterium PtaU1.Bin231]|nr:MAG: N-acetylmuramoyl-L-alanine amidase AmiC precursor [Syntrophaceae bacterium PtaU1.Bin231]
MQPMERFFQRRRAISLAGGILLLLLLAASAASAATEIFNVRHWAAPDHTRVVFDATEEPSYTVEREEALLRIVIRDAALSASLPGVMAIEKPGVRNILLSTSESQVTIELALSGHTGANIFSLSRIQDKPHRLVIDVLLPETKKKEAGESEASVPPLRKRIVVLDPGHGGEAPGAVGRAGTQEKDVVLGIAKMTRETLNRKPGYRAILTRDGDYYVSFRKRMQTARDNNADLFVSIHADASRSRRARGSSVYTLSLRGASSEAARLLAKSENLADVIGGSPAGESADESDPIVLNMFQTNSINRSKSYGQILLQHLDDVGSVKFRRIQEAPFLVLKLPEIPSVLVETAFISNPDEEKLLRSKRHQRKLAQALASAIEEFLPPEAADSPPVQAKAEPPTEVPGAEPPAAAEEAPVADAARPEAVAAADARGARKSGRTETKTEVRSKPPSTAEGTAGGAAVKASETYVVKRGDCLAKIALRYGVSVAQIAERNRIDPRRPLYVNRRLKIPLSGNVGPEGGSLRPEGAERKTAKKKTAAPYSYHKVRKGESLASIARKYGTTVKEIRTLNGMKRNDTLVIQQTIRIPFPGDVRS